MCIYVVFCFEICYSAVFSLFANDIGRGIGRGRMSKATDNTN